MTDLKYMSGNEFVCKIFSDVKEFPGIRLEEMFNLDEHDDIKELKKYLRKQDFKNDPIILNDSELVGLTVEGLYLPYTEAKNANFHGANLYLANLSYADLRGAHLRARLVGANLERANLEEANLSKARLWEVNLTRANLHKATLLEADLREANLEQASFKDADLSGANLEGAKLDMTNLDGADFEGANLARVDLRQAINLERALNLPEQFRELTGQKSLIEAATAVLLKE